jgi:DNA-binding beta-propeller fold protein YncE
MKSRHLALFTLFLAGCVMLLDARKSGAEPTPLPNGKFITPLGTQTGVGSFPDNVLLSPDGKFLVVTNCGSREYVSVLDARDGRLISQAKVDGPRKDKPGKKKGLYYGLVFGPPQAGGYTLYAARGEEQAVGVYQIDANGIISKTARRLITSPNDDPDFPRVIAGLALDGSGRRLYAVDNNATSHSRLMGALNVVDNMS